MSDSPHGPTPSTLPTRVIEMREGAPPHLQSAFESVTDRSAGGDGPPRPSEVEEIRAVGSAAAEAGLTARETVDLYLSAVSRAWGSMEPADVGHLPAGHTLVDVIRLDIPVLVEGYQNAGHDLIRHEESARLGFIDDLLRGDADVASLVQRAEPFGLDLDASHQIVLAAPRPDGLPDQNDQHVLTRAVIARYGDRNVLVTAKGGHLVTLIPVGPPGYDVDDPARHLHEALCRASRRRTWRVSVGRPYPGAHGVARSYQQAREAITLAERLHPQADMVPTRDLLIYRVLGRDRVAMADLVENVLTPLDRARGGAGPLVDTLEAYFAAGEVRTDTARTLHVSVRTVTYRLAKIASLTGYDPSIPNQRLTLQAAVIGARLLPWPSDHETGVRNSS